MSYLNAVKTVTERLSFTFHHKRHSCTGDTTANVGLIGLFQL